MSSARLKNEIRDLARKISTVIDGKVVNDKGKQIRNGIRWITMILIIVCSAVSAVGTLLAAWSRITAIKKNEASSPSVSSAEETDENIFLKAQWATVATSSTRLVILVLITSALVRELRKAKGVWDRAPNSWVTWVPAVAGTIG